MYGMTRRAGGLLFLAGSLVMLSGATCLDFGPPPGVVITEPPVQNKADKPFLEDITFNESATCCLYVPPGVTIYYTLDGSTPSPSNGLPYSDYFVVNETTVIKAIACKDGLDPSDVATAVYTRQSGLPESPHPYAAGRTLRWMYSHSGGGPLVIQFDQQCSLAADTKCTIYVGAGVLEAQDGHTITCAGTDLAGMTLHTLGTCGSVNVTLESTGTATDWGFRVASIEQTVRSPTFFPGDTITFNDPIQVGIRAPDFADSETTLVYTTDGSAPGATGGTTYTQPIPVTDTCVLKTVARQDGMPDSPVVMADLLRQSGYPESSHPISGPLKPNPTGFSWGTQTWVYRLPGHPASISVTFDSRTTVPAYQTDRGFQESISILYPAGAGGEILNLRHISESPYCGSSLAGRTVVVPGDTVVISLFRSADTDAWGFRVTDIQPGGTIDPAGSASLVDQVIDKVNDIRASNGLHPLRRSNLLTQVALGHATRMAEMDFFSHTDPATNSQPWDRAVHAGYDYSAIAENIAQGQPAVEDVMNAWMNSPGHRANILDWYPSELGVGIYQGGTHGTYWVQLFGNRW